MKKRNGWRQCAFTLAAGLVLATAMLAKTEETNQSNVALSDLPASIKEKAQKAFAAGQKCFIWKETNTSASSLIQGVLIAVGPFHVLARPENDGIAFASYFRFLAVDKDKGDGDLVNAGLVNETNVEKASAKESHSFTVLIPLTISNKKYSGKGTFEVYVAGRDGDNSQISNAIQLDIDLDNAPTME